MKEYYLYLDDEDVCDESEVPLNLEDAEEIRSALTAYIRRLRKNPVFMDKHTASMRVFAELHGYQSGGPPPPLVCQCEKCRILYDRQAAIHSEYFMRQARRPGWSKKQRILAHDNEACRICKSDQQIGVSLILPVEQGGTLEDSNLITLCPGCRNRKLHRRTRRYREVMAPFEFMVMARDPKDHLTGLGIRAFDVPPILGESVSFAGDRGVHQQYQVKEVIYAADPATIVGDLIVEKS